MMIADHLPKLLRKLLRDFNSCSLGSGVSCSDFFSSLMVFSNLSERNYLVGALFALAATGGAAFVAFDM